jgi:pimeloyl-ACP methyl ester carboxylesterase
MLATANFRGCPLSYEVTGAGEPIVFIQGVGMHASGWLRQVDELSKHRLCVTFDNRGIGRSHPAGAPITVEQMAADTLAIMDAAGIESAHVVGHSLGGAVAQEVALAARHRVLSLSLLCTSGRGKDAFRLSPKLMWLGLRSRIGTRRMRRHAFSQIVMSPSYIAACDPDALAGDLAVFFGHDPADSPAIAAKQLRALSRFNALARLGALDSVPTLVLSASHDLIFPPRFGRALASAIPGANFVEVRDASHGAIIQCAAVINALLLAHFDSANSGSRQRGRLS